MKIQTVFKAGNSTVVAIPKELTEELQIKPGQKVKLEKSLENEAITIKKVGSSKVSKSKHMTKEFKTWLRNVLEEDKDILDEPANR